MIFQHIATQIEFQLEVVDVTKITAVSMLTLQRPRPSSCTLQMATGVITTSTTLESGPAQMVLLGDTAAYVDYVPFKVTSKLLLKVCLDLDNGGDSWHDVYLPMPAGNEYKQGVCYMYNLVFDETKSTLESNYIKAKPINYIKQKELYVDF